MIQWKHTGDGDAIGTSETGYYEIERVNIPRWMVFRDGRPIGRYTSLDAAKDRAEGVHRSRKRMKK
jgi:hypothetical protein